MIELCDVIKRYPGRFELNIPRLHIAPGRRYALLGPNGSGKTTLLRILAGTLAPDGGTVRFSGCAHADVGYLPQSPHIFDLSVLQNVLLCVPSARASVQIEQAERVIEIVGLTHLKNARARSLSGGEQQRLALSRLIARPHRLLLLDEPTSETDISAEERMESALQDYCAQESCTLLFSSHAPGQALRLATDALFLHAGTLAESGEAEALFKHPKMESTQDFLRHWRL